MPALGSQTVRAVWTMALRKSFEDLKALRRPRGASLGGLRDWTRLREVLVGFLPGHPGAIASLLRNPVVATPLRCLRDGAADPNEMISEVVGQALFALGRAGALPQTIQVERAPKVLVGTSRDEWIAVPSGPVAFQNEGVFASGRPLEPQRGAFLAFSRDARLVLRDTNPLRSLEAHPDKQGNEVDLGGRAPEDWTGMLDRALNLIERHLPASRAAIDLMIRHVVPVGYHEEQHLSASYREALGVVYTSLHPSVLTMAEALLHETAHNVLHAMMELDPILQNPPDELVESPWRPDPRPLSGVLLAVHAFLPVEALLRSMIAKGDPCVRSDTDEGAEPSLRPVDLERRLERVRKMNADGVQLLEKHMRPTAVGQGVVDEIGRLDSRFRS